MSDQESTTSQSKNNYILKPFSGLERRAFPDLEVEIGVDPAALLLQLDSWLSTEGFERDGHLWIKKSAKTISRSAFKTWSVTKAQREIRTLANKQHLIVVAYFDAPQDATPYIRLNLEVIKQLRSIYVIDPTMEQILTSLRKPLSPAQRQRALRSLGNRIKKEQQDNDKSKTSKQNDLLDY